METNNSQTITQTKGFEMKKIRYIQMSPADGTLLSEAIIFTDDFETKAEDFFPISKHVVYTDSIIEMEIPGGFPLNNEFTRG